LHSVHQDVEDANRVVFLEHWLDRAALKVHFGVHESRAFAKALNGLASEPPTMEIYEAEPADL
jgi:quinol monooxygenase YgiN